MHIVIVTFVQAKQLAVMSMASLSVEIGVLREQQWQLTADQFSASKYCKLFVEIIKADLNSELAALGKLRAEY